MTIRVGFIGTGGISGAHLGYLKTRPDVVIAALCDTDAERAEKRRMEFGGKVFTDFRIMLEKARLDAVWICTPPAVRQELLFACADLRLPVFCEKPVERTAEQAREIADGLRKREARVQVGYVFRAMPVITALRDAMKDDRVHLAHSFYSCNISLAQGGLASWFFDKARSGGALVDQATHNFDLLRHLFGEVQEVHAVAANPVKPKGGAYTIDEAIGLILKFASGLIVSHAHTWVGDSWRNEITLSGEKRLYRLQPANGVLRIEDPSKAAGVRAPADFNQGPAAIYSYENDRFLAQVLSGDWSRNLCAYDDGTRTLELTLACNRAIDEGVVRLNA